MNEVAKGDWGAYSHGQLVNTTIYNVRRERRNELCAEGLRLMDVRRWCALDQMITTPYIIEGIKYWGTVYSDPDSPMSIKNAEGEFYDPVVDPDSDDANMSARAGGDYVRPYQIRKANNLVWDGYTFTRAHYLSPIGHNVFVYASPDKDVANSYVYQNPGWPTEANQGAKNID